MEINRIPGKSFAEYASRFQKELELLKDFELPAFRSWEINWERSRSIWETPGKKKPWEKIEECKEMITNKHLPGVYYFSCELKYCETLFNNFVRQKAKKNNNISFVPYSFKGGNCIYVGSRKFGIHGRMIQHLGFPERCGTGALYLYHVIKEMPLIPAITFHYTTLDPKYKNLTKHIEAVLQDELKPFIGKRSIENILDP